MNLFIDKHILYPLKDFLFVSSCFHCGNRLSDGERRLCSACWSLLKEIGENDYTVQVLKGRFKDGGVVDDFAALYYFEKGQVLQSLAHSLKYEEVTSFGVGLGKKLGEKIKTQNKQMDFVIPVPLNKKKERERGYNQSDYIAKGVSQILKIPVLTDVVHREKYTVTQTHLNAQERKENVADAFSISGAAKIKEKTILIVDDVITTGSTIQEVSRTLKEAGAAKIIVGSAGLAMLGEDV
ncbi:MAG: ComF family protein [Bacteroidota bacterium]|nr:ComF family protein [Bacteroidota bacterium]